VNEAILDEEINSASMPGGYNRLFTSQDNVIYVVFIDIVNPAGQENEPQKEYRQVGEKAYQISVGDFNFHIQAKLCLHSPNRPGAGKPTS